VGKTVTIEAVQLQAIKDRKVQPEMPQTLGDLNFTALSEALNNSPEKEFTLSLAPNEVLVRDKEALIFMMVKFTLK
jgi:hypothetical protein